jgi:hypothetical protein
MDRQGIYGVDDVPPGGAAEAVVTKLRELERRLEEEPENLGLRVVVAGALCEAGRRADAVELYRSVAVAYRDQGRAQQAIAVCRSILEIAPDDARCHALLATLEEPGPPVRRSSYDETPLPPAVPYHVADPTKQLRRVSESDLPTTEDAPTRPGSEDGMLPEVSGIANAARRISATLIGAESPTGPIAAPRERDAVPDAQDYGDDDDDQTVPRDLPMGTRRRAPGLSGGGAATRGPLAFAFFAPLPAERRAAVLSRFSRRSVPPRTVVIRQGEIAPSLVLVSSGRLEVRAVRAERIGAAIELGAIGPGEYIGEAPLLARAPSRASVVAATEAELLLLSPRDFYEIAGAFPALWAALKESAERRTREYDARL